MLRYVVPVDRGLYELYERACYGELFPLIGGLYELYELYEHACHDKEGLHFLSASTL